LLLQTSGIILATDGNTPKNGLIEASARIGVDYAGSDALLPYRFLVKGNPWVSKGNTKTAGS
jgi:DNA-3-methyladenine glycosylase